MTIEDEIKGSRNELDPLSNESLIFRALSSVASHLLPDETYYQVLASVLRERSYGICAKKKPMEEPNKMTLGHKLPLYGRDASNLSNEIKEELGELMALLLYHQIDKASSILLTMTQEDRLYLRIASRKLGELCEVCIDDIQARCV